ncbi:hypothetical protein HY630_03615 [Candidatus Uhrbacteria bacterium]|nr:hypothetical protein [Candidatus Uhrbacteria bacterium]
MEHVVVSSPRSGEDYSEDAYVVVDSHGTFLCAVIDTHHGGTFTHQQSSAVAQATAQAFRQGAEVLGDRLVRGLAAADQFLLRHHPDFGAVATAVEVRGSRMLVAQLGDSRLCRSVWNASGYAKLTPVHTAENPDELRRMETALHSGRFHVRVHVRDGQVTHRLYHRRWPWGWSRHGLMVTRSLGDAPYRSALTAEPEILTFDLSAFPPRTLFTICSDGAMDAVARMYGRIRSRVPTVEMGEVQALLEQGLLFEHDDDATAICFRWEDSERPGAA